MQNNNELQFLRHEIAGIYVKLEGYVGLLLLIDKDQIDQLEPDLYETIKRIVTVQLGKWLYVAVKVLS